MKQIPKCVFPSIKPKHRITETIKWGFIGIIVYASLDEVFICPQSAKNLHCKWAHCLLKKKINFLQEIQEDLLSKSARSRKLHPFSSHVKEAKSYSSITVTSLLQEICIWMTGIKPVAADEDNRVGYPSLIQLDFFVGLGWKFFFVCFFFNTSQVWKKLVFPS